MLGRFFAVCRQPVPEMTQPEVWLRGPLPEYIDELQPVAHSLLQVREEIEDVSSLQRLMVGELIATAIAVTVARDDRIFDATLVAEELVT